MSFAVHENPSSGFRTADTLSLRYYHSSSCASRQAVTCYTTANKFTFPTSYLTSSTTNNLTLSLPFNATGVSVLYDALRLEVQ